MTNFSKTDDELIEKTNKAITELVYPKYEFQKAYNYYYGKRDAEQFRYLEENFGIGNPTAIEFTPLIKKHIDALVGEFLGVPIKPKITCKDEDTISKITREKEIHISNQIYKFLNQRLKNKLLTFIQSGGQDPMKDDAVQKELEKFVERLDQSFISKFESSAQDVLNYVLQSRHTDFVNKLKQLLTDLLITGYTFYRVSPTVANNNVKIEVFSPLNTFIDRNPDSPYVKDSYRVVVRHWKTKTQILHDYGKSLKKDDIKSIEDIWRGQDNSYYYVRNTSGVGVPMSEGLTNEEVVIPGYPDVYEGKQFNFDLIPVYEVEWIETDKDYVMHRQSSVRIGEDIFILNEVDKNVVRTQDNPNYCTLSINGLYFLNRTSQPYSLMLACMSLQDKYDMLIFYRDSLIASSGTTGYTLDISLLPKFLGVKLEDRILKHMAYKKGGVNLIDSSQEGRISTGQAPINTIFNDFDDTVKYTAIQAIQTAIVSVEETASSITGVFKERLNGIEQRDAVTNVKQGATNSFTITKQYYHQMDLILNEMLVDCLNISKKVFKNGLQGTLILGDKGIRTFTALPEYYTITDYDVHIDPTTDTLQSLETLKQTLPSLIQGQLLTPDLILEIATNKNLPDLKYKIKKAMEKKEEENNQIQQLNQQLQEAQQQMEQLQNQNQQLQQQLQQIDQQKMQLEQQKIKTQADIDWYNAQTERRYKESTAETDKKRTEIEIAQLHDGNPYNDSIKNV